MKEQQKGNTTTAAATAAATATTRSGSKTTTRLNTENWIPKTEYPITRIPKTECWILNIEHCILDWMPTAKLDHNLQIFIFGFSVFSLFFCTWNWDIARGRHCWQRGGGEKAGAVAFSLEAGRRSLCVLHNFNGALIDWLMAWLMAPTATGQSLDSDRGSTRLARFDSWLFGLLWPPRFMI